jgi:tetratricopeptide (TPR) repeat protein
MFLENILVHLIKLLLMFFIIMLSGCVSNPLNQVTSERYSEMCAKYESAGDYYSAEQACYRAYVNTEWGNLDNELKSQKLYNLARIKRPLSKFAEAESLLKNSIKIEKSLKKTNQVRIGRRSVELAVNYAAQDKWTEALETIKTVIPTIGKYSQSEQNYIFTVLNHFGEHFNEVGKHEEAEFLKNIKKG